MKLSKRSFALSSAITASIFYTLAAVAFKVMMRLRMITPGRFADKISQFPGHTFIKIFKIEQMDIMSRKFMVISYLTGFAVIFCTALIAGFLFAAIYNKISSRAQ